MVARPGNHDSGKTTLIRALARHDSSNRSDSNISSRKDKGKAVAKSHVDRPDLGINFEYIDVADDGESGEGVFRTYNLLSTRTS